jgi:hypothetical protein
MLDFALSSYDADVETGLDAQFTAIRKALAHEDTWYAFQSQGNPRIRDVCFFIVDLDEGVVYMIYHNT